MIIEPGREWSERLGVPTRIDLDQGPRRISEKSSGCLRRILLNKSVSLRLSIRAGSFFKPHAMAHATPKREAPSPALSCGQRRLWRWVEDKFGELPQVLRYRRERKFVVGARWPAQS